MAHTTDPDAEGGEWQFSGFLLPTTTPVPDQLFDELLYRLAPAEMMVLLYIIRLTYGFRKQSDNISLKQMVEGIRTKDGRVLDRGTGLSKATVARTLASLEAKKVILRTRRRSFQKGDEPTTYHLNIPAIQPALDPVTDPEDVGTPVSRFETPRVSPVRHPRVSNRDTQQTGKQETDRQHVVVVRDALKNFGITLKVADQLTAAYPEAYLLDKLDLVQWLVDNHSPLVGKNPAGYLRRAIEEDYTPPPKYRSPAQRQAEAQERDAAAEEAQRQRREAEAAYAQEKALTQQKLRELYPPTPIAGTELTTRAAWEQTLDRLRPQLSRPNFEMWLANTALVDCDTGTARIVASSRFQVEHLTTRLQPLVVRTLAEVVGRSLACEFIPAAELLDAATLLPDTGSPAGAVGPQGGEPVTMPHNATGGQAFPTGS